MTVPRFTPLQFTRRSPQEVVQRARDFHAVMSRRRTTRHFSPEPVPREAIELAIRTAGTAPSGAHQQPWTFVAVSDPGLKQQIRDAAEREEYENYHGRMPVEWLDALAPLGTDEHKAHLTDAPWLVIVFRKAFGLNPDGSKRTYYYTQESVGIATGFFIAAVHMMGLVTLTHTPNPMGFRYPRTSAKRKGVSHSARWISGRRRNRAGHPEASTVGNRVTEIGWFPDRLESGRKARKWQRTVLYFRFLGYIPPPCPE